MEFLIRAGGRYLPEAAMTMLPEAWDKDDDMSAEEKSDILDVLGSSQNWTG